ncbi:MAG TPA: hypothetical protein PK307_02640 [Spirochaetota bacterium]|nr:hypothetical protein [Spirochaetota bacterium]HOD14127.1 hypothetical protein [Spirochaetota bacterium]HPG49174.1 hypothetical protein [Spirochaetota bacterium]HPN10776.1 hypothetical protein [Spirochaetota bacterium]HQL81074.1 hypothetical protein [Spirochaetota bacterium]
MNITGKKTVAYSTILMLLVSFSYCGQKDGGIAKAGESLKISETALLFAGKELPKESALYPFTQSAYYKTYGRQMASSWDMMQKPNQKKITDWWSAHRPSRSWTNVLYPFSGPDIMNALTFFPDAESIIMFGLEPPGVIPDPHSMDAAAITQGLNGLRGSLNDILHMNFFKTEGMAAEMSNRSFNSIAGIIMYFLATNGYTVTNARKIAIDADGRVVPGVPSDDKIKWENPPKSRVPGVEISFRRDNGKTRRVRYYMLNVIDAALASSSPNFVPYLKKEGPYATILKSASYLMHNDEVKFTKIRAAVMDSTNYLVQDDSGVPLRYFAPDKWKLVFHGYYDGPIGLFANRMQKDLKKAMDEKSTGTLPFSYGYDYKPGQSNLMTAEKTR